MIALTLSCPRVTTALYFKDTIQAEITMKLYTSTTSPYGRKVRICLLEHNISHEFIAESPADPNSHVARLNPLGKVPLLQMDDGEVVFNSPMIVEYLDSLASVPLIPAADSRWQAQRWHALGDGIVDAVVARMLEARRDEGKQDKPFIDKQQRKVAAALTFASERLEASLAGGNFLCDGRLTVADIALAVALNYIDLRYAHDWRDQHPLLAGWLEIINQRPSFRQTLP